MIRWPSLRHFIAAAILVGIAGPIVVFAYVKSGVFNVAASHPHSRLVEWITHETMINSVESRAPDIALPQRVSTAQAVRGFCQYEAHCVECHGGPAVAREQWVNGLNPAPPYLLNATRQWTPSQLYWVVQNGIKMTGMPAWRDSMTDGQIRDVTFFLEALPQMQPQTYLRWRSGQVCGRP